MSTQFPSSIRFPRAIFSPAGRQSDPDLESGIQLDDLSDANDSFVLSERNTQSQSHNSNEAQEENADARAGANKKVIVRDKRTHLSKKDKRNKLSVRDKRNELVPHGRHRSPRNDDEEGFYSNFFPAAGFNGSKKIAAEYREHRRRAWDPNYVAIPEPIHPRSGSWNITSSLVNRLNRNLFVNVPPDIYAKLLNFMPNTMLSNIPDEFPGSQANRGSRRRMVEREVRNDESDRFIDEFGTERAPLNPFFQEQPEAMISHGIAQLGPELDDEFIDIKPMKSVQDWLDANPVSASATGAEYNPAESHVRTRAQIRELAKNDPEVREALRKKKIRQILGILPTLIMGGVLGYTMVKVGNVYQSKENQI